MGVIVMYFLLHCVLAQPPDLPLKPDSCNRPAEFMYRQCCIFPPFFTREVAKGCGAAFKLLSADTKTNISIFRREPLSLCYHWRCILKTYSLLNANEEALDDVKYYEHLDRWVELNPDFTTAMQNAKVFCKNTFRMFLPLRVCEFIDIHGCIRNFINVDCPALIPTPECAEVKEFYAECREYYL